MKKRPKFRLVRLSVVVAIAICCALTLNWRSKPAAAENHVQQEAAAPVPTSTQLREVAVSAASSDGDAAPTNIEETASTLGQSANVVEPGGATPNVIDPRTGKPWSESPVYVISMRGQFTYGGPVPSNGTIPTGTSLTIMIDARSGAIVAESLSKAQPSMHEINPDVTSLGA